MAQADVVTTVSPREALYGSGQSLPALPPCVHYAGSERFVRKALALQAERGPVFDVSCDCEDGAAIGEERAHAVTMGVPSDGSYGIPLDYIYGVPVITANGEYTRVPDLPIDEFSREKMNATLKELEEERAGVSSLLG